MSVGLLVLLAAAWLFISLLEEGLELDGLLPSTVFFAAGMYLTFGVVLCDITYRKSVRYLVTDRRVIICSNWLPEATNSIALLRLNGAALQINLTSDGSLAFGSSAVFGCILRFWGPLYRLVVDDPRLESLEQPLAAYRAIRKAQHRLKTFDLD